MVIKLLHATVPIGPIHLTHQREVNAVIATLSLDNLKTDMAELTTQFNLSSFFCN
jgi:hypothetical protein